MGGDGTTGASSATIKCMDDAATVPVESSGTGSDVVEIVRVVELEVNRDAMVKLTEVSGRSFSVMLGARTSLQCEKEGTIC